MCIGLETINVRIIKKAAAAPMLPKAERTGDNGRSAIKIPNVISITPVIPENILVLNHVNAQEKKGLFSASGRMASASCLVNFNIPMQIKVTTNAYLNTKVQEKKESISATVFIIRKFEFLIFQSKLRILPSAPACQFPSGLFLLRL